MAEQTHERFDRWLRELREKHPPRERIDKIVVDLRADPARERVMGMLGEMSAALQGDPARWTVNKLWNLMFEAGEITDD